MSTTEEEREEREDGEREEEREEREDGEREEEKGGDEPQSLEAAQERIGVLERELSETQRESIKRRQRIKSLEGELAQAREGQMDEQQRAVEQARREEREKLEGEHRAERVRAAVMLAAATKLRDPQDAPRYLDLEELGEQEDGALDKATGRAIDKLLEERPYLAAGGDEPPAGARSPGPRRRQAAGTKSPEGEDMNTRIRKSLRH